MKKILVLCTGNSCRSQMAEGFIKTMYPEFEVYSAGVSPEKQVNPYAVRVMNEIGIDISAQYPKNVSEFLGESFDYVFTVCDNARETCPIFIGKVEHRIHKGFEDPAKAIGSEDEILEVYRKVREQIKDYFSSFKFE